MTNNQERICKSHLVPLRKSKYGWFCPDCVSRDIEHRPFPMGTGNCRFLHRNAKMISRRTSPGCYTRRHPSH